MPTSSNLVANMLGDRLARLAPHQMDVALSIFQTQATCANHAMAPSLS